MNQPTESVPTDESQPLDASGSVDSSQEAKTQSTGVPQGASLSTGWLWVQRILGVNNWTSLIIAVLLALAFRQFLFAAYKIPSGSMIPTLLIGDQLIVNKISYGVRLPLADEKLIEGREPQHGDVMVFRYPVDPSIDYIKRVIGVPGDKIRIEGRDVWVNGEPLPRERVEPYVYMESEGHMRTAEQFIETHGGHSYSVLFDPVWGFAADVMEFTVPEGEYFMMGDNRERSADSRIWGFVPRKNFVGAPVLLHFSWDSQSGGLRTDRMFQDID